MFDYLPLMLLGLLVPLAVLVIIVVGIVSFFNNRNQNNMDPNQIKSKESAKDVLLNLGAFIGLYTLITSLISLLFTVIDSAYPQITLGYDYSISASQSISWPVSVLIVFFPIFIILMWFLERQYRGEPDKQNSLAHKFLSYTTLFISGLVIAGDLVTVVYYFVDGQELTTGFLLKVLVLLVVASSLFIYFVSDLRGKLTIKSRIFWRVLAGVIILGSIIWGFSVLGSPRTQQLLKYDEQKVTDIENLYGQVENYYQIHATLPVSLSDVGYYTVLTDPQSKQPYEYIKTNETQYQLCAEFNKASSDTNNLQEPSASLYGGQANWNHPAGHFCFTESVNSTATQVPVMQPDVQSIINQPVPVR
jgi:hypothetical protein